MVNENFSREASAIRRLLALARFTKDTGSPRLASPSQPDDVYRRDQEEPEEQQEGQVQVSLGVTD
ncbi:MAG TPA: hypothetical protein VKZ59_04745 [Acidobacteriota bacterium]|nr:hypothetical protein [Acidobacteriota bacterium]